MSLNPFAVDAPARRDRLIVTAGLVVVCLLASMAWMGAMEGVGMSAPGLDAR